jgi:hypothetical protein
MSEVRQNVDRDNGRRSGRVLCARRPRARARARAATEDGGSRQTGRTNTGP